MTDALTRDEIDAKVAASEARTDTRLADALGEMRTSHASVMGELRAIHARLDATPTTFALLATAVGTGLAVFTAVLAVLAWGGDRFSGGVSVAEVARAAAREAVAQSTLRPPPVR